MSLSPSEEALVRDLIAQNAALLSLASSESTIISKLGATKTTLTALTAASSLADSDLMLVRQGVTDKSATGSLFKAYAAHPLASSATTQSGVNTTESVTPKGLADTMLGGVGQTWQSFTSPTRQPATTYTNSTGRPIMVAVEAYSTGPGQAVQVFPTVDSVALPTILTLSNAVGYTASCWVVVPNGSTYSVSVNAIVGKWFELR